MKHRILLATVLAFLVGGVSGYAINSALDNGKPYKEKMGQYDDRSSHGESMKMGHGMGEHGMHMDMMVKSEQEFIEHMIPHHQEAVETAKQVLERGATTPEIKQLVSEIITAQEKEIADMKQWYESWFGTPYADTGTYKPMMRDLTSLSSTELDTVFLEDMVHHHMGAIMMARSVGPFIEHDEMRSLTDAIIRTQTAEIDMMRKLQNGL
jgi:uncharacterized protein (DUF305 family)